MDREINKRRIIQTTLVILIVYISIFKLGSSFVRDTLDYEFVKVAKENAKSHNYILDVYDCSNFSESLRKKEEKLGYKTRIVKGWHTSEIECINKEDCIKEKINKYGKYENVNSTRCKNGLCQTYHAWIEVSVPIEATSGNIIQPNELRYYEEIE